MKAKKRIKSPSVQSPSDDLIVGDGGVVVSRRGKEGPSPFRRQHGAARPLDRYRERGSISQRQYEAGDRLWCDLMRAGLAPKVTANLLGTGGGGGATFGMPASEAQAIARQRVRMAASDVGQRLWPILQAVIWDEMAASAMSSGGASSARVAGLAVLQLALDALGDHYKMPNSV